MMRVFTEADLTTNDWLDAADLQGECNRILGEVNGGLDLENVADAAAGGRQFTFNQPHHVTATNRVAVGGAASFWTLVPDLGITRSTGACTLLVYATVICRTVATSRSYPFIGVFVDGVLHATSSAGGDADASDVTMSVVGQIAVGAGSHRIEIRINPGDATVDTRQMLVVEGKR